MAVDDTAFTISHCPRLGSLKPGIKRCHAGIDGCFPPIKAGIFSPPFFAEIRENLGETFLDHCTSSWCFQMHLPESPAQLAPRSLCYRGHLVLLFNKLPFKSFNLAANEVHSCSLASLGFPFHPVILTQSEDGSLGWKTTDIRKFRYKFRAFPFVKLIFRKNNKQRLRKTDARNTSSLRRRFSET